MMTPPEPPTLHEAIAELRVLLRQFDPLEVLSRVALYITTGHGDESKEQGPHHNEAHLEYLISFVTALPFPDAPQFPPPEVIQCVIHLLTDIHMEASIDPFYVIRESVMRFTFQSCFGVPTPFWENC